MQWTCYCVRNRVGRGGKPNVAEDRDIALFVVWALNKAAKRWGTTPSEACRKLEAAGVVSGHLAGLYDTARAMGERAILDDLSQLAAARGVAL